MLEVATNHQDLLNKMLDSTDFNLREVQEKTLKALEKGKNIILLSGCGTGKTEAAYMVSKVWDGRTIYALPMKTLATSIADRLNVYEKRLGSNEIWTLQHSSSTEDRFLDNKYSVTTIDQVLSGYFAFGSQSAIRGKNVTMSNIILDEVQLFDSEKSLPSTISMLEQTTKLGINFMLMTATMPESLMRFFEERFNAEIVVVNDEIPNREVTLNMVDELNLDTIESIPEKQIVVMNSHNDQIDFYNNIQDKSRLIILNNKLLPDDRFTVEQLVIKYFGKDSLPNNKILLATQVIEAGLDISADFLYTHNCPIDSLIQRAGRISRWGGQGYLTVANKNNYGVYKNKKILRDSQKFLNDHDKQIFDRPTEVEAVEFVLSDYYQNAVSEIRLGKKSPFTKKLKEGSRNDLIRLVEQTSIILSDTHNPEDFKRQKVSIYLNKLSQLTDTIYRLENKTVTAIEHSQVEFGDIILTKPKNWEYDVLGLRFSKDSECEEFSFPRIVGTNNFNQYSDYEEETWLEHSLAIKKCMKERLILDGVITNEDEIERLSEIASLHDIGKLTESWQRYIGKTITPLAHAPFQPRNNSEILKIKHSHIAHTILKNVLTTYELSLIIFHHGRVVIADTPLPFNGFKLDNQTNNLLNSLGFDDVNLEYGRSKIKKTDTVNPTDANWGKFIYLLGTLVQSDIMAIQYVKEMKQFS